MRGDRVVFVHGRGVLVGAEPASAAPATPHLPLLPILGVGAIGLTIIAVVRDENRAAREKW